MDLSYETFLALTKWFQTDLGQAVYEAESYELDQVLPDYFGYHGIQIGGDPRLLQSKQSPINHRVWVVPNTIKYDGLSTINSDYHFLPFRENSVDLVIIPHVLEFIENPQSFLSEIQRILIPQGRVVIFGFNPTSLWGIARLLNNKKQFPWCGHFHGITHLRYWLHQSDFYEEQMQIFFFSLPSQSSKRRHQWRFLEALGRMSFPWLGGLYMLTAHKQVSTLTPLKIKNKKLPLTPPKKIMVSPSVRWLKRE